MKRKTAIKLLMSLGYGRNEANLYLDERHNQGQSNERAVYGRWFMHFKESWLRGDYIDSSSIKTMLKMKGVVNEQNES